MLDSTRQQPQPIAGLRDIAADYDGYLIDLWGTLHNGIAPMPGALDCLARLKATGKRICLLSNAPRRVASVVARLDSMDVPRGLYDAVMSSGEATHRALAARSDPWHARLGRRCLHLGPPRDDDVHEGTGLAMVERVEEADFLLATGIDAWDETVEQYEPLLAAAAGRGLPMVCANPDLVVMVGDRMSICAGALAARYEALGGDVFYHGKPYPSVYDECFRLIGIDRPERVLGVGDSLRTDVAGANRAGAAALLLTGGIHAEEFALPPGAEPDAARLAEAIAREGAAPAYVAHGLVW